MKPMKLPVQKMDKGASGVNTLFLSCFLRWSGLLKVMQESRKAGEL